MGVVKYYTDQGARVSSPFGMRKHPVTGAWTMHNGIDFAGIGQGNPIRTPYAGRITAIGSYGGRGNTVVVKSAVTGLLLIFQHLHAFRVKRGDTVKRGDVVGTCGMTGLATGPHLHFEIRYDNGTALGSPVWGDPAIYRDVSPGTIGGRTYTVKAGDALYKIAAAHNVTTQQLIDWNKSNYPSLVSDPGLIRPGWTLYVSASVIKEYTVVSGDVFWRIAQAHNLTTDELIAANPQIKDPGRIFPGDKIYIPAASPLPEEDKPPEPDKDEIIEELKKQQDDLKKAVDELNKAIGQMVAIGTAAIK